MNSQILKKELSTEIYKIGIIDPHTHLREDDMTSHVVDILSYHWVLSELNSVGMDYKDTLMNSNLDLETRLKSAVPYLERMRNTATYRCLQNIFSELYGFHDILTLNNYKQLLDLSIKATNTQGWADSLLKRSNIVKLVTSVGNQSKIGKGRDDFDLMVDLHYLFWPSGSTDNSPWFKPFELDQTRYIEAIEFIGGKTTVCANDIKYCIEHFLHRVYQGRVKFFNAFLPIYFRFEAIDDLLAEKALSEFRQAGGNSNEAVKILTKYVTWEILKVLNGMKATLQLAVGAEYFVCGGRSLSRFESTWVSDMVKVCYQYPNIRFDFMNASSVMNHEMEVASKMIRNFYIQNMWWHTFVPSCIESLYEKLEIIPAVKLGGFYCDAYYTELTYGKYRMVIDSIIDVLCRKVENGVYTQEYAIEVANCILNKNPKELYGLG